MQRGCIALGLVGAVAVAVTLASANPQHGSAAVNGKQSGKIAFIRGSQVFVMNADGSNQHPLTSGARPGSDFEPQWSPDGRELVYTRQYPWVGRRVRADIYVVGATSGRQRRLTRSPLRELDPVWSPDGRTIAFVRDDDIYVMNRTGSATRRLTHLRSAQKPAWSPDGRRIAFFLWRNPGGIWVINVDGSGQRRLPTRLPGKGLWSPAWSPDGDKLAFVTGQVSGSIFVINADGSARTLLTRARIASGFAWSHDGRRIVYEGARGDGVYSIDVDGGGKRRLARDAAEGFAWSPDGRKLAFAGDDRAAGNDIYVVNADGSGRKRLTDNPEYEGTPVWSPKNDGR
jgi:Tol biopolymer transport system component